MAGNGSQVVRLQDQQRKGGLQSEGLHPKPPEQPEDQRGGHGRNYSGPREDRAHRQERRNHEGPEDQERGEQGPDQELFARLQ